MTDLDDEPALRALDAAGMLGSIASMGSQFREGYAIGRGAEELPSAEGIGSLVFCGMGGSAVAGDVVRAIFRQRLRIPVDVQRGPDLPEFAGSHSLVMVCSYSGNTSESIECYERAVDRGARVIALASGGRLDEMAREGGHPLVRVPGGLRPRAAFGWLVTAAIGALEQVGLLPPSGDDISEAAAELEQLADRLSPDVSRHENPAKDLGWRIGNRVPVIWGADGLASAAAARWKTQFNENAKSPAFSSALPELDHNEVVGWTRPAGSGFFVIGLRHDGEHRDVAARFPASFQIAQEAGAEVEEVRAAGRSPLARLASLVIMGDFTSAYAGLLRGLDPSPIDAIDRLKAALAR